MPAFFDQAASVTHPIPSLLAKLEHRARTSSVGADLAEAASAQVGNRAEYGSAGQRHR